MEHLMVGRSELMILFNCINETREALSHGENLRPRIGVDDYGLQGLASRLPDIRHERAVVVFMLEVATSELLILCECIAVTLNALSRGDLHPRVGADYDEIKELQDKLHKILDSHVPVET